MDHRGVVLRESFVVADRAAADVACGGAARRIPVPGSEDLALSPDWARPFMATPTIAVPADPVATDPVKVMDTAMEATAYSIPLTEVPAR